jgi:hypothetical protein
MEPTPDNGNNRSRVNKVAPQKQTVPMWSAWSIWHGNVLLLSYGDSNFVAKPVSKDCSGVVTFNSLPGNKKQQTYNKYGCTEKKSSNVISMVNVTHKSALTFPRGLELRRQTGLKVRILVLSRLPAGEIFFVTPGGLSRPIFTFYMCNLILYSSIKTDKHK